MVDPSLVLRVVGARGSCRVGPRPGSLYQQPMGCPLGQQASPLSPGSALQLTPQDSGADSPSSPQPGSPQALQGPGVSAAPHLPDRPPAAARPAAPPVNSRAGASAPRATGLAKPPFSACRGGPNSPLPPWKGRERRTRAGGGELFMKLKIHLQPHRSTVQGGGKLPGPPRSPSWKGGPPQAGAWPGPRGLQGTWQEWAASAGSTTSHTSLGGAISCLQTPGQVRDSSSSPLSCAPLEPQGHPCPVGGR